MRGQIQSGSRRLNRHWQSSDRGDYYGLYEHNWKVNNYVYTDDYNIRHVDPETWVGIGVSDNIPVNNIVREQAATGAPFEITGSFGYKEAPYPSASMGYSYLNHTRNKVPVGATYKLYLKAENLNFNYRAWEHPSLVGHDYYINGGIGIWLYTSRNKAITDWDAHILISMDSGVSANPQGYYHSFVLEETMNSLLTEPIVEEETWGTDVVITRFRGYKYEHTNLDVFRKGIMIRNNDRIDITDLENRLKSDFLYAVPHVGANIVLDTSNEFSAGDVYYVTDGDIYLKIGAI